MATPTPDSDVVEGRLVTDPSGPKKADVKFACPTCGVNIVIAERAAGKVVSCQLCGARIRVPQPSATASAPAASRAPGAAPLPRAQAVRPPLAPAVSELIERLRNGDPQAGRALLMTGESIIQVLADTFAEHSLEEPDATRGAEHIINLLSKCGGACVPALVAKLGKSRHAYFALAKVGTAEAVQALVRELASVNWRRVEIACQALGRADTPAVVKVTPNIEAVSRSTRIGEVYTAAVGALTAIRSRYPSAGGASATTPQAAAPAAGA